ncbi:DUF6327 family protein [Psychroflexus maritimus]|uniref:Uncharacterized protein n=1 Tax=Psychroflexus maritimus TaxID=2714865 RepID=A0A967E670_9FLAO|nr:DUF6327 family protein [Psychroflexus maritimus]NGZ89451.1 hypothetical protein [Psychroflexus maritimus]
MKKYKSFSEIDKDLKLLQLQKDIHQQKAKINFVKVQQSLSLQNLLAELTATLTQKYLYKNIGLKILERLGLGKKY